MEGEPTVKIPYVLRIAIAGAIFAVSVDYFLKPTLTKSLRVS